MKIYSLLFVLSVLSSNMIAQKSTYQIGILIDKKTEKTNRLIKSLSDQITAVVGEDATVVISDDYILSNDYDIDIARDNYEQLIENTTDIILAFGVINDQVISAYSKYEKPTILFSTSSTNLSSDQTGMSNTGVNNFLSIYEQESYSNDLSALKELTNFKNIGIAVQQDILNALPLKDYFDSLVEELEVTYAFIPFRNHKDIISNNDSIDALYLINGFLFNDDEVREIADTLTVRKIPSFTINGVDQVKNGLMATNQPDDNTELIIRRIAMNVERYINGEYLSGMSMWVEYEPKLTLNYNTINLIDAPIKSSLLSKVNLVAGSTNPQTEKKLSLSEVMNSVLNKNLSLQARRSDIDLRGQDVEIAKSAYLPNISIAANALYTAPEVAAISFGQIPELQSAANINLQQVIFSADANANIDIQENILQGEREQYNAEQLDRLWEGGNSYFDLLFLKSNLQLQLHNQEVTNKNHQLAIRNYEAGMTGKADVLRFQSEMAQNKQMILESNVQMKQVKLALRQMMNVPDGTTIDIQDINLSESFNSVPVYDDVKTILDDPDMQASFVDFLIEEANENAPELKALGYSQNIIDRTIKLQEQARYMPTIAVQGEYGAVIDRRGKGSVAPEGFKLPNIFYSVGIQASVPIFNQNLSSLRKEKATIQRSQNDIIKEDVHRSIAVGVEQSVLNLKNQISSIELAKISQSAAEEALELMQVAYTNGAANSVQLIDAQINLLNAKLGITYASQSYWKSILQIERTIGYYFLMNTAESNDRLKDKFLQFYVTKQSR